MGEPDVFQFGEFTLDARERRLSRGNQALHLTPKTLDVLLALVREPERLLTKDELLTRVWPNAYVAEGILTVHISALRKALGDEGRPATYIETVPRAGYRFVATVSRLPSERQSTSTARFAEVHELMGRGRAHLLTGSFLALREAVAAFKSAIEIEPDHAGAHAGLALACCIRTGIRAVPHQEGYAHAKTSALRALALDPASADAQVALGTVLFLSEWAWAAAERSFRRALQINPAHTEGLLQYGMLMEALGRLHEGLGLKQQALERDSPSALVFVQIAMSYWHQRRYEDTIACRACSLADIMPPVGEQTASSLSAIVRFEERGGAQRPGMHSWIFHRSDCPRLVALPCRFRSPGLIGPLGELCGHHLSVREGAA